MREDSDPNAAPGPDAAPDPDPDPDPDRNADTDAEPDPDSDAGSDQDPSDGRRRSIGDWSPRAAVASWTAGDALRALAVVVFVVVVAPFVLFAIPQLAGAQHSYVVLSGSMAPTIETGSVVLVQDVDPSAVEAGDVITFGGSANAPPTTHRVVDVEQGAGGREFVTKGDNNENVDRETVQASELVGEVPTIGVPGIGPLLLSFPYVGHVVTFGQTTAGIVLLVVVPFGLLAADSAIRTVRGAETESSSGGAPDGGSDGDPDARSDDGVLVLSPRTLLLAAVLFVAAGALAGGYAVRRESVAAATLGAGLVTAGLLAGALPLFDRRRDGTAADAAARTTVGRVPPPMQSWPVLEVDSAASLRETSAADGSLIVEDPDSGRLFLFRDGVAYTPQPDDPVDGETVADYLPEPTDYDAPEVDIDQSWDDADRPRASGPTPRSGPRSGDDGPTRNGNGGET